MIQQRRTARIYKPTKTAMQSGVGNTKEWLLEFVDEQDNRFVEPLMGWTGTRNTLPQVKLWFETAEEAVAYAKENLIDFELVMPKERKVQAKSYAENFRFDKPKKNNA